MLLSKLLFLFAPLAALAGGAAHDEVIRHDFWGRSPAAASSHLKGGKTYRLVDKYQGQSFFNGWDFWTQADPTHGMVNFLSEKDARNNGLVYVQGDGPAVMGVDDHTHLANGKHRNSVRISSKKKYNGGLFIADFAATPYGCGTWPAYWSVGPDWPNGGEIDILEGVHNDNHNQMTVHTSEGCTLDTHPRSSSHGKPYMGQVLGTTCASRNGANSGCAFLDGDTRAYGAGLAGAGGGVFAHRWDASGIAIWQFARADVPHDIAAGHPDPQTWPAPVAFWSAATCDAAKHFYEHQLVLDITLCGDWAGSAYGKSGCPGTCSEAVANPSNFKNAKFKINYIAVYD